MELVEQLTATDAEVAHRPAIEVAEQRADRAVQFGQREEALVAQAGEDPALDHLHADLDLGLVARPTWSRRQDRRAAVPGEVLVGRVQPWFGPVGLEHPRR